MSSQPIGQVTHYYDHLQVAVVTLTHVLRTGDYIYFSGHTTNFHQQVTSLHINHQAVWEGQPGQAVALKVGAPVRLHDHVFPSTAEEAKQALDEELLERAW